MFKTLQVIRVSTGTVLLDTSLGGFTFSDQFLQIATRVPSNTMYGFGEQEHQTLAVSSMIGWICVDTENLNSES